MKRSPAKKEIGTSKSAATALKFAEAQNPVLLVTLVGTNKRDTALLRAANLARLLGTHMYVVRVIPRKPPLNLLFPQRNLADTVVTLQQTSAIARRTWRWCNAKLLTPLPPERIWVRQGTLAQVAIETAGELKASMVVLPGADITSSADVMEIVGKTKVPILVSRRSQPREAIVAASDLLSAKTPVLRRGAKMGEATKSEITFVHNVKPGTQHFVGTAQGGFVVSWPPEGDRVKQKRYELRQIAAQLGDGIDTVVVNQEDTADAILEVARERQADLVVVGRHNRTWVERVFGANIASAVVERAKQSVLVVPIGGGA